VCHQPTPPGVSNIVVTVSCLAEGAVPMARKDRRGSSLNEAMGKCDKHATGLWSSTVDEFSHFFVDEFSHFFFDKVDADLPKVRLIRFIPSFRPVVCLNSLLPSVLMTSPPPFAACMPEKQSFCDVLPVYVFSLCHLRINFYMSIYLCCSRSRRRVTLTFRVYFLPFVRYSVLKIDRT
jgi:hypothetical protein